ncbi:MAG: hypothetical protein IJ022_05130 [Burkholderiaceae bacterium]|nr:hypothetical protein [Burkholderiaceae bacterium]
MSKDESALRNVLGFLAVFLVSGGLAAPLFVEKMLGQTCPAEIQGWYFKAIWYLETATDTYGFYIVNILAACVLYLIIRAIANKVS